MLLAVLIVLGTVATVGEGWMKLRTDRQERFERVAGQYEAVRQRLGALKRVGFVCADRAGDEGDLKYYMAASVLAPVVVVRSAKEDVVLALFATEPELRQLARTHDLSIREQVGQGVAILERGKR